MTRKKTSIIVLSAIMALCLFAFLSFQGFISSIRDQRTCEWANIDNIELHAHLDIPKVTKWDCNYEKGNNTKKAFFIINKVEFDIDKYIETYNLKKIRSAIELIPDRYLNFEKESSSDADLYYKKDSSNGERSDVLLDKKTGKLWVTIKFK